jgi:hypothetical protein
MGFKLGFTVDEGVSDVRPWDAFGMKRFTITRGETLKSFRRRLLSGPLPVGDIQPPPGSRVVGIDSTVTVDVTDIPADITTVRLRSGPSMKKAKLVRRDGRTYMEARIRKARVGFRVVSMSGTGPDGRRYYACWDMEMGDKSP